MNTVKFTFDKDYSLTNDIFDYYCDYDDEEGYLNVYVDDVEDELINGLNDVEMCEFYGMDSEYLLNCNRSDYY
jgi:hypothetical protein